MPSVFPGAIDSFTDPLTNSPLNSPSHAGQHQDLNDAVEKVEQYMGLVKVIPTGITSAGGTAATLASDGTVNVGTGNTSIRIDGSFSALYDNYRMTYSDGVGSTALDLRLQFGVGATLTATNYNGGRGVINVGAGTWVVSADNNATFFTCGGAGTAYAQISLDILQPNYAGPTLAYGMFSRIDNGQVGQCWTHNNNSTAFTSVSISTSTGSITGGQIRIYGYRN
jgi:hypothetical protein